MPAMPTTTFLGLLDADEIARVAIAVPDRRKNHVLRAWVAALIDGPPSDAEIEEVWAWVPLPAEQGR